MIINDHQKNTFVSVFPSVESTASWSELFRREGRTFNDDDDDDYEDFININDDHDDDDYDDGSYEDDNGVGANETNCPLTFVKSKQRISFASQRKKSSKISLPNKVSKNIIAEQSQQKYQRQTKSATIYSDLISYSHHTLCGTIWKQFELIKTERSNALKLIDFSLKSSSTAASTAS